MSHFSGTIVLVVHNMDAAVAWYREKLDLPKSVPVEDGAPGDMELVSRNEETRIVLSTEPGSPDRSILDTGNAAKAREWLLSRGVSVGPVEVDGQGTRYIEMRDLENNMIEICEEP